MRLERIAIAVAEGVELLGVAEVEAGLLAHPAAQAEVQSAVGLRLQRTERQGVLGSPGEADGQDAGNLGGDRHDHRVEAQIEAHIEAEIDAHPTATAAEDNSAGVASTSSRSNTVPKCRAYAAATSASGGAVPSSRSIEVMRTAFSPQGMIPAK